MYIAWVCEKENLILYIYENIQFEHCSRKVFHPDSVIGVLTLWFCAQHMCVYMNYVYTRRAESFFSCFSYFNYEIFRDFIYRLIVHVCKLFTKHILRFSCCFFIGRRHYLLLQHSSHFFFWNIFYLISLIIRWFLFIWIKIQIYR